MTQHGYLVSAPTVHTLPSSLPLAPQQHREAEQPISPSLVPNQALGDLNEELPLIDCEEDPAELLSATLARSELNNPQCIPSDTNMSTIINSNTTCDLSFLNTETETETETEPETEAMDIEISFLAPHLSLNTTVAMDEMISPPTVKYSCVYHVVYHTSYNVPVFFLDITRLSPSQHHQQNTDPSPHDRSMYSSQSSSSLVSLQEVVQLFKHNPNHPNHPERETNSQTEIRRGEDKSYDKHCDEVGEVDWTFLTQLEHPILKYGCICLHPCRTAQVIYHTLSLTYIYMYISSLSFSLFLSCSCALDLYMSCLVYTCMYHISQGNDVGSVRFRYKDFTTGGL